jgi:uncharacterized protein (TIGR02996 family)
VVSDDEAFIRAIVDRPGDDLPRLVYADWLDERGDPRGEYLRAEMVWAKAPTHGDEEDIIKSTVGLDPVWAARISRPPVGVCCDHIRLTGEGPPASAADLDQLETTLDLRLPVAYRAFLLNHNGGVPSASFFHNPARRGSELGTVEKFYGVSVARGDHLRISTDADDLISATQTLYTGRHSPTGARAFAPLAANEFPYMNLIGLTSVRAGRIYWHNNYTLHRSDKPRKVADSLPEFLAMLQTTTTSILH